MTAEPQNADDVPDRFRVDFTGLTLNGVYRVEKKIADGGMGSIYLAEDTNLGRRVVVKVPHPRFLGEPGFRSRFAREVAELVRLEHPHIARILARGEHDEVPYFVLQYLGGGSLEDRIVEAEAAPMDPADVLGWLTDVATTLDFVHEQGIVHRDIKPGNILFDEAGNVFLSDFGVAKVVDSDDAITGTGVGIGSPKYMAPEQGVGRDVGPVADQYALGASLYEALAGSPPFAGETPIEILVAKGREDPAPLDRKLPDLPEDAAAAVMRALSRDPTDRFGSCTDFAQSFTAGLAEAGIATPEGTPLETPWVRSRPIWPVIAVVLFGIALGAGLFLKGRGVIPDPDADIGPKVILRDPGAKPWKHLRLSPSAHHVQRLRTNHMFTMKLIAPGEKPVVIGPIRGAADSEFRGEAGESPYPFTWKILSTEAPALVGIVSRGLVTKRCRMLEFEVGDAGETSGQVRAALTHLSATVRQLPVPFPEAAVGVGARWDVTETVQFFGLRLVQTSTYELVERDGAILKIHLAAAQTAAPGEILSMGAGLSLRVSSLQARGEGDVEIDLGQFLPVRSSITIDMDIDGQVETEDGPVGRSLEFQVSSSAGPIEEKR